MYLVGYFFQTDMIFFDEFKVPTIKFGKRFAEEMVFNSNSTEKKQQLTNIFRHEIELK